jgi:Na+-driven multidrug efflux pump
LSFAPFLFEACWLKKGQERSFASCPFFEHCLNYAARSVSRRIRSTSLWLGLYAGAPGRWVGLFTTDPDVLAPGMTYLRIVGLVYDLFGFGFVMSFAAQGAGKVLWPSVAVSARLIVAAGLGWLAVTSFDGTMTTLAIIVAASFPAYAGFASLVMFRASAWQPRKAC